MSTTILLSGVTASGKTTLAENLRHLLSIQRIITVTTRPQRANEVNGKDYEFVDEATFKAIEASGGFAETNEFDGALYGTKVADLERKAIKVLVLDPLGHRAVKALLKSKGMPYLSVFLDADELVQMNRFMVRAHESLSLASYKGTPAAKSLGQSARRLASILTVEAHWREVARSKETPYDLVTKCDSANLLELCNELSERAIAAYKDTVTTD